MCGVTGVFPMTPMYWYVVRHKYPHKAKKLKRYNDQNLFKAGKGNQYFSVFLIIA